MKRPRTAIHLIALAVLGGYAIVGSWMMVDFVRDKLEPEPAEWSGSEHWMLENIELRYRPRLPLGEPIVGEAMDDYTAFDSVHIEPGLLRDPLGESGVPRALTAEEVEILRRPQVTRLVERFVRASRREDVGELGFPTMSFDLHRRIRLVVASAAHDATVGQTDAAFTKAASLTRLAQDTLGREPLIVTLFASAGTRDSRALLRHLAEGADAETAARWLKTIERLLADQLPPAQIAGATVLGEAHWYLRQRSPVSDSLLTSMRPVFLSTIDLAESLLESGAPPEATRAFCFAHRGADGLCNELLHEAVTCHASIGSDLRELAKILSVRSRHPRRVSADR